MEHVLLEMVKKTMDLHVLLSFQTTTIISIMFDLLMFRGGVDTFALVITYLDKSWIP
jgi:pyruvate/oxaloacetate carboxyltransferase